jgi:hypothetical protein
MAKKSIITRINGIPISEDKALEHVKIIQGEVTNIPLTDEERQEHQVRTARVLARFHKIHFESIEIWNDLKWIKDNRTYREKYDTFNDYCRDELGKDNSQIYRYIKDAEIKEKLLLAAGDDVERTSLLSLKESNTRFIRTLPEEVQLPIWKLAYGIGQSALPKKEDGSIEMTTSFLQSVANTTDEIIEYGGINIDGRFVPIDNLSEAAKIAGVGEHEAKAVLMAVGVSEDHYERIKRQEAHIKEKSMKADVITLKGTVRMVQDINGSEFPMILDSKGNEQDVAEIIGSFNNRFVHISLRSPIREGF